MKKIRLGGVAALVLALAAFACLFLRGGVRMEFSGRPENVVHYYSFYDHMPLGYGNWFPWLTILAGTGAAVSAFLVAFCGARVRYLLIFSACAAAFGPIAWLWFNCFTVLWAIVCALYALLALFSLALLLMKYKV